MGTEATLKKSLFPVQRVAEIMASRAAAIFFFCVLFFGKKNYEILTKKNNGKKIKVPCRQ